MCSSSFQKRIGFRDILWFLPVEEKIHDETSTLKFWHWRFVHLREPYVLLHVWWARDIYKYAYTYTHNYIYNIRTRIFDSYLTQTDTCHLFFQVPRASWIPKHLDILARGSKDCMNTIPPNFNIQRLLVLCLIFFDFRVTYIQWLLLLSSYNGLFIMNMTENRICDVFFQSPASKCCSES